MEQDKQKTHEVKCWIDLYPVILSGVKKFDVRINDRGYGIGDLIVLQEWNNEHQYFTGREAQCLIEYILPLDRPPVNAAPGYVALGIKKQWQRILSPRVPIVAEQPDVLAVSTPIQDQI